MGRELLFSVTRKDIKIDFFSGTGAGGQHRNKHQNCVRMCHTESGARATGQKNKNRKANLVAAFKSLINTPHFKMWQAQKTQEICAGRTIEQEIDEMMLPENLKVEYKEDGAWNEAPNNPEV